jgi:hypothetical protein
MAVAVALTVAGIVVTITAFLVVTPMAAVPVPVAPIAIMTLPVAVSITGPIALAAPWVALIVAISRILERIFGHSDYLESRPQLGGIGQLGVEGLSTGGGTEANSYLSFAPFVGADLGRQDLRGRNLGRKTKRCLSHWSA